mgnify:CR=1 FL=1
MTLNIFVTVGTNQYNFDRLIRYTEMCLRSLEESYKLFVQYGHSTPYEISNDNQGRASQMFSRQEAEQFYAQADLVFSHCGIGSIHNSLQYTRPTVLVPRLVSNKEHSDNHQLQIAAELKQNPLLLVVLDEADLQKFPHFFAQNRAHSKEKVDLTNYELAETINKILYETKSR